MAVSRTSAPLRLTWLVLVSVLFALAPAAGQGLTPPLAAHGHQPNRGTFSLLPWEQIDMVSGNVVLTVVDIDLPGYNGMNLQVVHTLNLGGTAPAVSVGVPGPTAVLLTKVGGSGAGTWTINPNPTILYADGREEYTFQTATGSTRYRTHAYAVFDTTARTLSTPNGWVYTFDHVRGSWCGLTHVADPFGNALDLVYESAESDLIAQVTQTLAGNQTRTVTFTRGEGSLTISWTPEGDTEPRAWVYTYDNQNLVHVTPPVGDPWTYAYASGMDEAGAWRTTTVTTPQHGTVTYELRPVAVGPPGLPLTRPWRVVKRTAAGHEWLFSYVDPGESSIMTTVSGPDGTTTEYHHDRKDSTDLVYGNRIALHSMTASQPGLSRTTTTAWRLTSMPVGLDLVLAPDGPADTITESAAPPLVSAISTTTRDADGSPGAVETVHSRTYIYRDTALNDYGHPEKILEQGEFERTWSYTYTHLDTLPDPPYVVGLLGTESLAGSGGPFVTSHTYEQARASARRPLCTS